ncbi:hypothetical protein PHYBOEH_006096 [Phytophthora boehmeriae]|uniref:RxLR effector protein n=1 Tax=Phytophthora boehmeriae TaxID=109152 RepID=A0A8T1X9C2_9STRA|nr:hypothetical protein PHYBOEH_006096 [Phytophthora boehmeriae]
MRLQNLVVMAAAVLVASADGLQVISDLAPTVASRANVRYLLHADSTDTRGLIPEAIDSTKAPRGYGIARLEEDEYEGSEEEKAEDSEDEARAKKKKQKKVTNRNNEETPAPTETLEENPTHDPVYTPLPSSIPRPLTLKEQLFVWLWRIFKD